MVEAWGQRTSKTLSTLSRQDLSRRLRLVPAPMKPHECHGTIKAVSLVVFYLLACSCRLSMPGLDMKRKLRLFLYRVIAVGIGLAVAYSFLWLCINRYLVRNPDTARVYMFSFLAISVIIGEMLSRKKLRSFSEFSKRKFIPMTY